MENVLRLNQFEELNEAEMQMVDGGGAVEDLVNALYEGFTLWGELAYLGPVGALAGFAYGLGWLLFG